jgi:plasmid maintenance system killer protein
MKVLRTTHFERSYAKAPHAIQKAFDKQSSFLLQNLHHPSLRAKKYDESKDRWQARVNDDWRFLFSALRTMPTYSRTSSAIRNDFHASTAAMIDG